MLKESDVRNITKNVTIILKHSKGSSGALSILAEKISRNDNRQIKGAWEDPKALKTLVSGIQILAKSL